MSRRTRVYESLARFDDWLGQYSGALLAFVLSLAFAGAGCLMHKTAMCLTVVLALIAVICCGLGFIAWPENSK